MKADLHTHTLASGDSLSSQKEIAAACRRGGIDCLAITDHNRLTRCELDGIRIIPGEEIMTTSGEIIGLFLSEEIPARLTAEETVRRIKGQGGLVFVPHPFDHFRRTARLKPDALARIAPFVDIVEVLNGRNLLPGDDLRARESAASRRLPAGAGSDAHTPGEIGAFYVEMEGFDDAASFLRNLGAGRLGGRRSPWRVHLFSTWAKWRKRSSY
jgi:hypothetical protein